MPPRPEIDAATRAALDACRAAGLTVLNQAVLLRGINDTVAALEALVLALFEAGVLPYYVHLLDPVAGAAHFDTAPDQARALEAGLRARLPGYLVPRFVREVAGAPSKLPLAESTGIKVPRAGTLWFRADRLHLPGRVRARACPTASARFFTSRSRLQPFDPLETARQLIHGARSPMYALVGGLEREVDCRHRGANRPRARVRSSPA